MSKPPVSVCEESVCPAVDRTRAATLLPMHANQRQAPFTDGLFDAPGKVRTCATRYRKYRRPVQLSTFVSGNPSKRGHFSQLSPGLTPPECDEGAKFLCCRKRRIYELIQDGRLPRHGDRRRVLVLRPDVEALDAGVGRDAALRGQPASNLSSDHLGDPLHNTGLHFRYHMEGIC